MEETNANLYILVTSTHGEYNKCNDYFRSPLNLNQIETAPYGSCNLIHEGGEVTRSIKDVRRIVKNNYKNSDIDLSHIIKDKLMKIDSYYNRYYINNLEANDEDYNEFYRTFNQRYKLYETKKSFYLPNKKFLLKRYEKEQSFGDDFSLTLLCFNKSNGILKYKKDITYIFMGRELRGETNYSSTTLKDILIKLSNGIRISRDKSIKISNLILIDFTCSVANNDNITNRNIRFIRRNRENVKKNHQKIIKKYIKIKRKIPSRRCVKRNIDYKD